MVGTISWDLPEPFFIELVVEADAIDEYDHTNNAVYLQWLDRVAWEHAVSVGAGPDVHVELRRGMAAQRTELRYLAPALLGDRILVANWIVQASAVRASRRFQIIRPSDGATLMRALSMYACIDLDSGRPRRMPPQYADRYVVIPSVAAALEKESRWPFLIG